MSIPQHGEHGRAFHKKASSTPINDDGFIGVIDALDTLESRFQELLEISAWAQPGKRQAIELFKSQSSQQETELKELLSKLEDITTRNNQMTSEIQKSRTLISELQQEVCSKSEIRSKNEILIAQLQETLQYYFLETIRAQQQIARLNKKAEILRKEGEFRSGLLSKYQKQMHRVIIFQNRLILNETSRPTAIKELKIRFKCITKRFKRVLARLAHATRHSNAENHMNLASRREDHTAQRKDAVKS